MPICNDEERYILDNRKSLETALLASLYGMAAGCDLVTRANAAAMHDDLEFLKSEKWSKYCNDIIKRSSETVSMALNAVLVLGKFEDAEKYLNAISNDVESGERKETLTALLPLLMKMLKGIMEKRSEQINKGGFNGVRSDDKAA
jgi:hypothetical protein